MLKPNTELDGLLCNENKVHRHGSCFIAQSKNTPQSQFCCPWGLEFRLEVPRFLTSFKNENPRLQSREKTFEMKQ